MSMPLPTATNRALFQSNSCDSYTYSTWSGFIQEMADLDIDYNLVFDFYFQDSYYPSLNLWFAYPRKGKTIHIRVLSIEPTQLEEVKEYLRQSWESHSRHFLWVDESNKEHPANIRLTTLLKSLPSRGTDHSRGYCGWGPYEDSLAGKDATICYNNWDYFIKHPGQTDANLLPVFDFYFSVEHKAKPCKSCHKSGLNPESLQIAEDYYDFAKTGRRWCDKITQDEVEVLVREGRLRDLTERDRNGTVCVPTAEEVNSLQQRIHIHDCINRWILIKARCKRLGVWGLCSTCKGKGWIRLSRNFLRLNLWLGLPKEGKCICVVVNNVPRTRLNEAKQFLKRSLACHQQHFAWANKTNKET